MRKLITLFFLSGLQILWAQQPYYNDVNITLSGQDLYFELQGKINQASSIFKYGDIRNVIKTTDEDPNNSNNVLLIYGYNDADNNCTTDRTRNKNDFGGMNCEYNREHVFARSNANPPMGDANNNATGIVADPHNLRSADQQMNNNRGNRKMAIGSGNAGNTSGDTFYPGDEWKGDVARMMMYMYTRYGAQCLPTLNGAGSLEGSTQMLQIYLQWNVEDPVNDFEDQRNPYLENIYGNRNPFIDNPYLATIIWGGPVAEDRWGIADVADFNEQSIVVYPNPSSEIIWVGNSTSFDVEEYSIYDMSGRMVKHNAFNATEKKIDVSRLDNGVYLLELSSSGKRITKKILVH